MSSNAFFNDAAANTVNVLSSASAGDWVNPNRTERAASNPARLRIRVAPKVCAALCALNGYSDGRIAMEIASSFIPLTCITTGLADNSYFMVLRMPPQSVAPLKALGLSACPSCTTSTQPPPERLIVYVPACGGSLKVAKPANVPSLGARSGGVGRAATPAVRKPSLMPFDGNAASSPPDTSLIWSGAVNAARSRSIGHLNLSQPLGSSAAHAGAATTS